MSIVRGAFSNLGKSFKKYLVAELTTDSVTVKIGNQNLTPDVRIANEFNNDWTLPVIQISVDNVLSPKPFIGQTKTTDTYLIIIDIYTTRDFDRLNLADYIQGKIAVGFPYIVYSENIGSPNSPTETTFGRASTDFVSNQKIDLGANVDEHDLHRHRISFNCSIQNI